MADLSYLAGLFDGEGSIGYRSRGVGRGKRFQMQLRMTEESLVRLYHDQFGGLIRFEASKNPRHRPTWCWRVTDRAARETYDALEPFLILKKFFF